MPCDTVATVQNYLKKKDKMAKQNGTVDEIMKNTIWTVQKYYRKKNINRWLGKENKKSNE